MRLAAGAAETAQSIHHPATRLRQTKYPAKRPESNPDVTVTTTDCKHHQQKLKRPQGQGKTTTRLKPRKQPKPTIRTETAQPTKQHASNKKTETNQETAKPLKRINVIRN